MDCMMNEEGPDADAALAVEARRGDRTAFVALATRWWTPLYRFAWNMSGSASFAAQVTERALATAVQCDGLARAPFKLLLYRLAVQLMLAQDSLAPMSTHANDEVGTLREALQRLDAMDRAALVLREIEQLPLEEVARVLSAPAEQIRLRVHRALVFLTRAAAEPTGSDAAIH
jgi:DNA-directed RNA polymerase specialized sigma24 family protein